ncbi:hypothetical protein C8Q76DRAFT_797467 [Earliella scabrosa]|nr:hypothetical protein C8Q76DRAFT_797467 [Earliella scabrosa]
MPPRVASPILSPDVQPFDWTPDTFGGPTATRGIARPWIRPQIWLAAGDPDPDGPNSTLTYERDAMMSDHSSDSDSSSSWDSTAYCTTPEGGWDDVWANWGGGWGEPEGGDWTTRPREPEVTLVVDPSVDVDDLHIGAIWVEASAPLPGEHVDPEDALNWETVTTPLPRTRCECAEWQVQLPQTMDRLPTHVECYLPALEDVLRYFARPLDSRDELDLDFEWDLFAREAVRVAQSRGLSNSSRIWALMAWAVGTLPPGIVQTWPDDYAGMWPEDREAWRESRERRTIVL